MQQFDVFVSYRHRDDKEWVVNKLVPTLKQEGIEVWLDDEQILFDIITEKMNEGVENSRFVLLVITDNYFESDFTNAEWYMGLHKSLENHNKVLLPILRTKSNTNVEIPLVIRMRAWVDMRGEDENIFNSGIQKIVRAVK